MARKITAVYYLSAEFQNLPKDPLCAHSRVRIEVGDTDSTINDFIETYEISIYTPAAISAILVSDSIFREKSILVVREFSDEVILEALNRILPELEKFAARI